MPPQVESWYDSSDTRTQRYVRKFCKVMRTEEVLARGYNGPQAKSVCPRKPHHLSPPHHRWHPQNCFVVSRCLRRGQHSPPFHGARITVPPQCPASRVSGVGRPGTPTGQSLRVRYRAPQPGPRAAAWNLDPAGAWRVAWPWNGPRCPRRVRCTLPIPVPLPSLPPPAPPPAQGPPPLVARTRCTPLPLPRPLTLSAPLPLAGTDLHRPLPDASFIAAPYRATVADWFCRVCVPGRAVQRA